VPIISGGAAGGASGALTQVSSTVLGGAGNFDIQNIAGTGNTLVIVGIVRGAYAGGALDNVFLRFNNDSAANYMWTNLSGNGTSAASGNGGASASQIICANMSTSVSDANFFSIFEVRVPGYASTTWKKAVLSDNTYVSSAGTTPIRYEWSGFWNSTAAITRVQVLGSNAANFVTGSQLIVYLET